MAKKKKAPQLEAWCWYCDREFEDDKVLLQHQKAKHYKCSYCPRRLNTAGGLTVHLHQVHKAEPTKIENALPGRDSFDIEIYGMVGIPEEDLAEWKSRRVNGAANMGGGPSGQPGTKRQKVEAVALTPEQLKAQLEAHKALMSGQAPPPGSVPPGFGTPSAAPSHHPQGFPAHYTQPPPGFRPPPSGFPSGPPPTFAPPYGIPPPVTPRPWGPGPYGGPAPNITTPQPSPHQVALRKGDKNRIVYTDSMMSPDEKMASSSKYAYVDPDDPPQPQQPLQEEQSTNARPVGHTWLPHMQQQPHMGPPPGYYGPPPGWQAGPPPPPASYGLPFSHVPNSQGAASPYPVPDLHNGAGSPPYAAVLPPRTSNFATSAPTHAPYSVPPPTQSANSPPPGLLPAGQQPPPHPTPSLGAAAPPAPPFAPSPPPPPAHVQAQSYPAMPPNASPPASHPEANTAEALAAVNDQAQANLSQNTKRESDAELMERKAASEKRQDVDDGEVALAPLSDPAPGVASRQPGRRARAADLF